MSIRKIIQQNFDIGKISIEEFLKANVQLGRIEDLAEFVKGGQRAAIGEIRKFGDRDYIKTTSGWKFHGKGTGAKAQEHSMAKHLPATLSEKKKEVKFDRGEAHHAKQVAYHTQQRDMHQNIHDYIAKTHGGADNKASLAYHAEVAKQHSKHLERLARIKDGTGLLSIAHLKVGDKFIAISEGFQDKGKEVPITIVEVDASGIVYMTPEGHRTYIDRETGSATGTITYTHNFSKWKPADPKAKKGPYDDMPAHEMLKKLGIDSVSQTHYEAKRGSVFNKEHSSITDTHVAQRIRSLVNEYGKPTKVTYEKFDTSKNNDDIEYARRAEHEYGWSTGTSVTLHWGDKSKRVF